MRLNDQQRLSLRDRLLVTYEPQLPEDMQLDGWDDDRFSNLMFRITHFASSYDTYAGAFAISHVALDDGEDAERGVLYLIDCAHRGNLPDRHDNRASPVLLRCTTERGWDVECREWRT